MALPLFSQRFLHHFGLQALFGVHLLKLPVFSLKLLQACHHRSVHATILGAPFVKGGAAHTVFTTQLRHRRAGFGLFEDRHDLAIGESGLLHCLNFLVVEILLQLTAVLWGDYRPKGVTDKLEAGHDDVTDAALHTSDRMVRQVYDRRRVREAIPAR